MFKIPSYFQESQSLLGDGHKLQNILLDDVLFQDDLVVKYKEFRWHVMWAMRLQLASGKLEMGGDRW